MTPDPSVEFREIAAALGVTVTRAAGFDRLDFRRDARHVRWIGQAPMLVHVTGFETTIVFAAGQPQPLQLMRTPLPSPTGIPLFGRKDERCSPATWLADDANLQLIANVELREGDYLSLALNWLTWSFTPSGAQTDLERFDALLRLVDALPSANKPAGTTDGIDADLALLPEPLRRLEPLIRTYAISDDAQRAERMDGASTVDIADLSALTTVELDALNQFLHENLDRVGTPEQDVALILSSFAEAAAEARSLAH